jgi:hypothetical protein
MKKLLSILCCSVILLTVSSCTKQYITPNPNKTVTANLASSDWTLTDPKVGVSYQASINAPIDNASAQLDGVVVSISYDGGNTYEQVPEVYNNVSYSYTYNEGNVTIYAQSPTGGLPSAVPDPMIVKIVVVYSN